MYVKVRTTDGTTVEWNDARVVRGFRNITVHNLQTNETHRFPRKNVAYVRTMQ